MKIEMEKSKAKRKPRPAARHPHIRGRYVEFDVDVMSPQEPTPSEGSAGRSEGQAELEEFQDATESPSTVGGSPCDCRHGHGRGEPECHLGERLTIDTDRSEAQNGERQHHAEHGGPGRGLQVNGNQVGAEVEPEQDVDINEHAEEQSADESPDSDSEDGADGQWNAVCVACLRVYSRDPGLTITLVTPEDKQGASNLVTGQEPAGATM